MTKLKAPSLSFQAKGTLADTITFQGRGRRKIARTKPTPNQPNSIAQRSWRTMYQKAVALWHALSASEQQDWESQARSRHMTGFAWFMSQALKPNPGLYLPLQGGIMAGDIDMAKNRLLRLPLPLDSQEPLTLAYFTTNIAPYLYNEGARVYHNTNQSIPNLTLTTLAFNSEKFDSDNIHDPVTNNSRLTCRTAGTYLISFNGRWETNATGQRWLVLFWNATRYIAMSTLDVGIPGNFATEMSTIYTLAINDFLQVQVWQDSGGALDIRFVAEYTPNFMMQRIGQ